MERSLLAESLSFSPLSVIAAVGDLSYECQGFVEDSILPQIVMERITGPCDVQTLKLPTCKGGEEENGESLSGIVEVESVAVARVVRREPTAEWLDAHEEASRRKLLRSLAEAKSPSLEQAAQFFATKVPPQVAVVLVRYDDPLVSLLRLAEGTSGLLQTFHRTDAAFAGLSGDEQKVVLRSRQEVAFEVKGKQAKAQRALSLYCAMDVPSILADREGIRIIDRFDEFAQGKSPVAHVSSVMPGQGDEEEDDAAMNGFVRSGTDSILVRSDSERLTMSSSISTVLKGFRGLMEFTEEGGFANDGVESLICSVSGEEENDATNNTIVEEGCVITPPLPMVVVMSETARVVDLDAIRGDDSLVARKMPNVTGLNMHAAEGITALPDLFATQADLRWIELPPMLDTLGTKAFFGSLLTTVTLPPCVKTIPEACFHKCFHLRALDASQCTELTSIGNYGIADSTSLRHLRLPMASLASMGQYALQHSAANLPVLTFGSALSEVGEYCFHSTSRIARVDLSSCDHLEEIPRGTFGGSAVTAVHLPSSLRSFGPAAFLSSRHRSITFPSSLTSMDSNCFTGCKSLALVDMSAASRLVDIPSDCFCNCKALSCVKWPPNLEAIHTRAFSGCQLPAQASLPTSMKHLGPHCFGGSGIKELHVSRCAHLEPLPKASIFGVVSEAKGCVVVLPPHLD